MAGSAVFLVATPGIAKDKTPKAKQGKVTICHKGKTISVAQAALKAHQRHGDTEGACVTTTTIAGGTTTTIVATTDTTLSTP